MMSLAQYLTEVDETQGQFAARLGMAQGTISKLCRGLRLPSLVVADQIEKVTGGKVPMSVWCSADHAMSSFEGPPAAAAAGNVGGRPSSSLGAASSADHAPDR